MITLLLTKRTERSTKQGVLGDWWFRKTSPRRCCVSGHERGKWGTQFQAQVLWWVITWIPKGTKKKLIWLESFCADIYKLLHQRAGPYNIGSVSSSRIDSPRQWTGVGKSRFTIVCESLFLYYNLLIVIFHTNFHILAMVKLLLPIPVY